VLARHKREESVMMRKVEEGALTDAAPGARNDPHRLPTAPPSPATAMSFALSFEGLALGLS